jgi:hypothetical protein
MTAIGDKRQSSINSPEHGDTEIRTCPRKTHFSIQSPEPSNIEIRTCQVKTYSSIQSPDPDEADDDVIMHIRKTETHTARENKRLVEADDTIIRTCHFKTQASI